MRQPINTKKLIGKIEKFANDISSEKEPFILFGLFQREKLINSWDLRMKLNFDVNWRE